MIYNANASRLLLGCLCIEPTLCHDGKHKLNKDDFIGNEFHLRLWQAINHLSSHGAKVIDAIDIYSTCVGNDAIKAVFDNNDTKGFIDTIKQLAKVANYDRYFDEVKKCSLLNRYKDNGFDISPFEADAEKHTIEEIVAYYDERQQKIKAAYYADKEVKEVKAGDDWENVKESFKTSPMYGASTFSKLMNEAARGWVRGQLMVHSCASGSGKTTLGLYNLALICCPKIWSDDAQDYIDNPCYQHCGGLFIQYELDIDRELTPKLLASISGVPCYNILDNRYNEGEEARVDKAIEILHESNIRFVTMPSYTIPMLETYIRQYANLYDCKYVVMDYISENMALSNEMASGSKTAVRTDQVLAAVAACLKNLAVELNVAIMSFTQTNAKIKGDEEYDASVISGSMAIQNTCDICGAIAKLRKKEEEVVEMMKDSGKFNVDIPPNRVATLFKMRFSKYPQGSKLYFNLDLNTGKVVDCFATYPDGKPLDMAKLTLTYS